MRRVVITACLFLGACASSEPPPDPWGVYVESPSHASIVDAEKRCDGPFVEWSHDIFSAPWPYRVTHTVYYRCMKTGDVVGPYTYRTDGME